MGGKELPLRIQKYDTLLSVPKTPDIEKYAMYEMWFSSKRNKLNSNINFHFYIVRFNVYTI